ncbi:MAG: DHH family phosphoesterase [Clostridiales bacterium]|nr:DHH family phosphoesterase [Clostridiales bacterium]
MNKSKIIRICLEAICLSFFSIVFYYYNLGYLNLIMFFIVLIDNICIICKLHKQDNENCVISSSINKGIYDNINNIILPIIVVKENGEILWKNNRFNSLERENIIGKNIGSVIKGIDLERIITASKVPSNQRVRYKNRIYDIQGNSISINKEVFGVIYLNDVSDLLKCGNDKESVILLEIDNYNDIIENLDEDIRPLLIADIEKNIYLYAQDIKAMIKKYDSSKYVLTAQDKYIDKQIKDGFPILDVISNIHKGNKLEPTLSIGIGRGGATPQENSSFAKLAKELALGRGGDQVVVKNNDDIKFFGGNTKEIEKRTKVRARVVSNALEELIYESSKVYIIGHKNPDMDCFGSAVALSTVVEKLGKKCNIILKDDTNPIKYYLNKLEKIDTYKKRFISLRKAKEELDDDTLLIIVDVHNKSYVSDLSIVNSAKKKVIIDHHRRSPNIIEGAILSYIEVFASSTSEMITEIIQYILKKPIIPQVDAEGLLAGIYMDTKNFTFKTGVRTFEAASFLRDIGADTIEVKKMFTDNLEDYLLIADIIKSAQVDKKTKIAIATAKNKKIDTVIIAKAADELVNISGIDASFVLANIGNDVTISGRSTGDINVQVVLEALGGGGHMNIAGAKVYDSTIDEVIVQLKEAIKKYIRIGE